MDLQEWLLTPRERGNRATRLDARRSDGLSWSTGNEVRPLVHGTEYFGELLAVIRAQRSGDLLLFTDWRGDPDELLGGAGTEIGTVLCDAARRGVIVKGLVWRSHWDRLSFSERENAHLGAEIEDVGGECLLDMRVRAGGSHHQKFVVARHPGRAERDVAFVGGIDLCHSRHDDAGHSGDPRPQPFAAAYGPTPPWHDVQIAVRGPAVGDVEATFRERWQDPSPLSRSLPGRLRQAARRQDTVADPLPEQLPDPDPRGRSAVQVLRTYPRLRHGYPFAPQGERSIARAYGKALARARSLIYLEDQYLWNEEVCAGFAQALAARPDLRMVAVVPPVPDQDGRLSQPLNEIGRIRAVELLSRAGGDRFALYSVENPAGTPVYVHAKVCVVDDVWAAVGSDNINLRSWTHDSELACAVIDDRSDPREPRDPGGMGDGARVYARDLRLRLAREHLDRPDEDADDDLLPSRAVFEAFARCAAALDAWHAGGRRGPRPPGRLRTCPVPRLSRTAAGLAAAAARILADPDGRPRAMRRARSF
jgi:phosphatidylserine/phosphatidylglycerophosphate/cardiolipin synthase-like enzyme